MASKAPKGPMAVNKSNTPVWMRAVIIMIVISFVGTGIAIGVLTATGGSTPAASDGSAVATATVDTISQQYKARVDAAVAAAASDPTNPDIVIEVGHAYFEWAVDTYESGQAQASIPIWKSAVSYYDKVLAIEPSNDIALGNKAFALYYAQDAQLAPAALEAFIEGASDNKDLAQQVENARGMLAELESAGVTTAP